MTPRRRKIRALGVSVDALTLEEAVRSITGWLSQQSENSKHSCRYVVTPNLDHAVLLSEREDFRNAYAEAALVLPDGMPLLWAARLRGNPLRERVAGSDLGPAVLAAAPEGTEVFLLGASEEASLIAAKKIEERCPNVKVVGRSCPPLGFEHVPQQSEEIVRHIRASGARLIIVGLGAPKQELWVHAHRELLVGTVVLCLGATIDFLAEKKKRAPQWMQRLGLEWVHRVASEPRRLAHRYAKDAWRLPGLLWRNRG